MGRPSSLGAGFGRDCMEIDLLELITPNDDALLEVLRASAAAGSPLAKRLLKPAEKATTPRAPRKPSPGKPPKDAPDLRAQMRGELETKLAAGKPLRTAAKEIARVHCYPRYSHVEHRKLSRRIEDAYRKDIIKRDAKST